MKKIIWFLLLMLWLTACVYAQQRPPVSPIIPNKVPVMLDNQWRLTEMILYGGRHEFDSIRPVLITFQPGSLLSDACNGKVFYFDTREVDKVNEYRLIDGVGTQRQCVNGGTEQEGVFFRTLRATNRYELISDTLILSGDQAKITFVIDNEAKKPPDW